MRLPPTGAFSPLIQVGSPMSRKMIGASVVNPSVSQQLLSKLEARYVPEPNSGCWLWLGKVNEKGYGQIYWKGRQPVAHRVSYELHVGQIPEQLVLDHRCRNRLCINPGHLEPVTSRVNTLIGLSPTAVHAAKQYCSRGHPLAGENLRVRMRDGAPRRFCLACKRMTDKRGRLASTGGQTASPLTT